MYGILSQTSVAVIGALLKIVFIMVRVLIGKLIWLRKETTNKRLSMKILLSK